MTVKQLLEYSPSVDSLLKNCLIRRPTDGSIFNEYKGPQCSRLFKVSKYYTLEYICYTIQLILNDGNKEYDITEISVTLGYAGAYYVVTLSDLWRPLLDSFKVLSTEGTDELRGSGLVISRGMKDGVALHTYFHVSHISMVYHKLPSPYDTKCRNFKDPSADTPNCLNKCMLKRVLRRLDRIWYGARSFSMLEKRPLSYKDLENDTVRDMVTTFFNGCRRVCSRPECLLKWTLTSVQSDRIGDNITFKAFASQQPSFIIVSEPKLTPDAYAILLMSCIGSWFGLSVLSFEPTGLFKIRRKAASKGLRFTYQVANLTHLYFKYETMTMVTGQIIKHARAPNIHLCPYAFDVFDLEAYNRDNNSSTPVKFSSTSQLSLFHSMFTIRNLFQYSPALDDVIQDCIIRKPGSNRYSRFNRSECQGRFKIAKYVVNNHICYNIRLTEFENGSRYSYSRMATALTFPGMYYAFKLTDRWSGKLSLFKIVSVEGRQGEDKALTTAPLVNRGVKDHEMLYNVFSIQHSKLLNFLLLPPYDSMCRDYVAQGLRSSAGCYNKCLYERCLKEFDRLWYATNIYEPVDKRPLSFLEMQAEPEKIERFEEIFQNCHRACSQRSCTSAWSLTTADLASHGNATMFTVMLPNKPSFVMMYEPKLTIESYLIFFMSCIGSWFGLSVLSFNPSKLSEAQSESLSKQASQKLLARVTVMEKLLFMPDTKLFTPINYRAPSRVRST
ncbi:hypothetical protein HDE_01911 [Halotydeus destructor]|nr:hypothetical protein HDE_01911 [Halotydeus destructor]